MRVTYNPENGNEQTWEYKPKKVKQSEAEMIEKRSGLEWDAFNKAVLAGSSKPRKVLLWHCMRKDHPVMRWEDVPDFAMAEVTVEFDTQELGDIRAAVEKDRDMDDATKQDSLRMLDEQITAFGGADPLGRANSSSSDGDTPG